ncbi:hypothetical protein CDAR_187011, partial [Caerostris darwini]
EQFATETSRRSQRAVCIEQKNKELLDNEDLKELWMLLEKKLSPPLVKEDHMISYSDFRKVSEKNDNKFKSWKITFWN